MSVSVTTWKRKRHCVNNPKARQFFKDPVEKPYLFLFETEQFSVPTHAGDFSFKVVLEGSETYAFRGRDITLKPGQALFTNQGQEYSSRVEDGVRSFSAFFPVSCVGSILSAAPQSWVEQLNAPNLKGSPVREIPALKQELPALMTFKLGVLTDLIGSPDGHVTRTRGNRIFELLVEVTCDSLRNFAGVFPLEHFEKIKKTSTRQELLKRLGRAHDYILDNRGQNSDLRDLADIACLSEFHFLRLFKGLTGVTPGAYTRNIRLAHARDRLQAGVCTKTVAREADYASPRELFRALSDAGLGHQN